VPLPWGGVAPPFEFGPQGSTPWLPQPASWAALSVDAEDGDPSSMLTLYREVIALRRTHLVGVDEPPGWITAETGVLAFRRGPVVCIVNLSPGPVQLPAGTVLITSGPLDDGRLPADSAAWVELDNHQPDQEQ
jgi:alpha-glucosidase